MTAAARLDRVLAALQASLGEPFSVGARAAGDAALEGIEGPLAVARAAASDGGCALVALAGGAAELPRAEELLGAATVAAEVVFGPTETAVVEGPGEIELPADAAAARVTLGETAGLVAAGGAVKAFSDESVRSLPVRVAVELGRVRMPVARAVSFRENAVVELDHAADDPVDILVNGRRFGTAKLVLTDEGEWAFRIESIFSPQ